MYEEDDLLPLSALQHLVFCERQCALIHLEGLWAENARTVEGEYLHDTVDQAQHTESRGDLRISRGLMLRSLRLGLSGKADAVEFHRVHAGGVLLRNTSGLWQPFPVEYKRGRPKRDRCDEVQVCAQALCMEEMLGVSIPGGALYYGATRHRLDVEFNAGLRAETESAAARLHKLITGRITPPARKAPKCDNCSLLRLCMPEALSPARSASRYMRNAVETVRRERMVEAQSE
jgi:CRISPR-associated exonuclease Cas4